MSESVRTLPFRGRRSRNKVSVGEPAEGSLAQIYVRAGSAVGTAETPVRWRVPKTRTEPERPTFAPGIGGPPNSTVLRPGAARVAGPHGGSATRERKSPPRPRPRRRRAGPVHPATPNGGAGETPPRRPGDRRDDGPSYPRPNRRAPAPPNGGGGPGNALKKNDS